MLTMRRTIPSPPYQSVTGPMMGITPTTLSWTNSYSDSALPSWPLSNPCHWEPHDFGSELFINFTAICFLFPAIQLNPIFLIRFHKKHCWPVWFSRRPALLYVTLANTVCQEAATLEWSLAFLWCYCLKRSHIIVFQSHCQPKPYLICLCVTSACTILFKSSYSSLQT